MTARKKVLFLIAVLWLSVACYSFIQEEYVKSCAASLIGLLVVVGEILFKE